jgi:DNA-directed RNA polymerase specialized sigma24 family protein
MARKKKKTINYVDNEKFSQALAEYAASVKEVEKEIETATKERRNYIPEIPQVPDYIARCFMDIAENLANKGNFAGYSFRDEMVLDAIENCLRAVRSFDPEGVDGNKPNAFSYFTTVVYNAFLRRLKKEARQTAIKERYIAQAGLSDLSHHFSLDGQASDDVSVLMAHIDSLRAQYDQTKEKDTEFSVEDFEKKRQRRRRIVLADSSLEEYFDDM